MTNIILILASSPGPLSFSQESWDIEKLGGPGGGAITRIMVVDFILSRHLPEAALCLLQTLGRQQGED